MIESKGMQNILDLIIHEMNIDSIKLSAKYLIKNISMLSMHAAFSMSNKIVF